MFHLSNPTIINILDFPPEILELILIKCVCDPEPNKSAVRNLITLAGTNRFFRNFYLSIKNDPRIKPKLLRGYLELVVDDLNSLSKIDFSGFSVIPSLSFLITGFLFIIELTAHTTHIKCFKIGYLFLSACISLYLFMKGIPHFEQRRLINNINTTPAFFAPNKIKNNLIRNINLVMDHPRYDDGPHLFIKDIISIIKQELRYDGYNAQIIFRNIIRWLRDGSITDRGLNGICEGYPELNHIKSYRS